MCQTSQGAAGSSRAGAPATSSRAARRAACSADGPSRAIRWPACRSMESCLVPSRTRPDVPVVDRIDLPVELVRLKVVLKAVVAHPVHVDVVPLDAQLPLDAQRQADDVCRLRVPAVEPRSAGKRRTRPARAVLVVLNELPPVAEVARHGADVALP